MNRPMGRGRGHGRGIDTDEFSAPRGRGRGRGSPIVENEGGQSPLIPLPSSSTPAWLRSSVSKVLKFEVALLLATILTLTHLQNTTLILQNAFEASPHSIEDLIAFDDLRQIQRGVASLRMFNNTFEIWNKPINPPSGKTWQSSLPHRSC